MEFWKTFMSFEQQIVYNIRLGTDEGKELAMRGLELAGRMSGYPVVFQLGIDLRNGKKLPERKDSLELVLSPNWDRGKVGLIEQMYDAWASKAIDIPSYWNVVKYQPFSTSIIYDMDLGGVTHEDFEYCVQFNYEGQTIWVGVLMFVRAELAASMLKKVGGGAESDTWVPDPEKKNGKAPLIFLNAAVGEYNMITRIRAVEFLPSDSHVAIPRYSLSELHEEFVKIDRQKYASNTANECVRCGHYSYQTNLSKCAAENCEIYYCDEVCRRADLDNHKYICK